ncbi:MULTISPECIES: cytochrome aa3 quinol oxidase subunit IV [Ureibacillus]|jgi:cytochrome aa3-600 menaquinol oxidase subunit 4|uniref:Quinol oxidase subunit 4 n=1 Tax=Ureibacillus thermosphaericus TaxID=51173 RepID=A0A840Q2U5_URETH|nr:cytochrome aa3 quinol oxidase subunit IV [Ureibacillus thermosphaericus]MBB5149346.1 cytochrome aa3-600 menaquinol oxidase subunit 4 [Ureibacillus thermosphaericus]NKZ32208.1 cytochrome aa3 quinol oxidase subunit IV [Ureibacillus thermosphaericus]
MKELFPAKQVGGYIFSLVLTIIALLVYFLDFTFPIAMSILLVTAFVQATVQLVLFMHAGETEDGKAIYTNVLYGIIIAVVTIIGSLLILIWDM